MARLIPNENTWVGFVPTLTTPSAPTATELDGAIDLTPFVISLNASAQGNTVPTPAFDTLFETSISGTNQATFDGDFYRDDVNDLAWETLPRATTGFFIVSRFGGSGADNKPASADVVEVWPIMVTSRSMANMSNNTVMTFTLSCSVPEEPTEDATVSI